MLISIQCLNNQSVTVHNISIQCLNNQSVTVHNISIQCLNNQSVTVHNKCSQNPTVNLSALCN